MKATLTNLELLDSDELSTYHSLFESDKETSSKDEPKAGLFSGAKRTAFESNIDRKQPDTKKRKRTPVSLQKLLKPLSKEQLEAILLTASSEYPTIEDAIRKNIPSFDVLGTVQEAQKLKQSLFKAFPHTRYGSSYDHYSFTQVRSAQNTYVSFVSKPLKLMSDAKQWQSLIEYLLIIVDESAELPNWEASADRQSKEALFKRFDTYLRKVILQNDVEVAQTYLEKLRVMCATHNVVENGTPFVVSLELLSAKHQIKLDLTAPL